MGQERVVRTIHGPLDTVDVIRVEHTFGTPDFRVEARSTGKSYRSFKSYDRAVEKANEFAGVR